MSLFLEKLFLDEDYFDDFYLRRDGSNTMDGKLTTTNGTFESQNSVFTWDVPDAAGFGLVRILNSLAGGCSLDVENNIDAGGTIESGTDITVGDDLFVSTKGVTIPGANQYVFNAVGFLTTGIYSGTNTIEMHGAGTAYHKWFTSGGLVKGDWQMGSATKYLAFDQSEELLRLTNGSTNIDIQTDDESIHIDSATAKGLRVNTGAAAFTSDAAPNAAMKFTSTNGGSVEVTDTAGNAIWLLDAAAPGAGNFAIGSTALNNDVTFSMRGLSNTGVLTWMEDEDYFRFEDDVIFNADVGFPHAEIYAADTNATLTISGTGKANKVQITSFATNGLSINMTPDHTNDHITVNVAGRYLCVVSMHIESVGAGGSDNYGFSVYKNNGATEFSNLHGQRDLAGGGGDEGSVSLSGIIDLAVNDTIEVWIWNNTNTDDIIIDDINLSLVQIAG